jgi:signal transduction histidine kinase
MSSRIHSILRSILHGNLILKLMGAFLMVIIISALVIYFLAIQATQNAFRLYTTQNSQLFAQRLAPDFADYFSQTGSWQGVEGFMQTNTQAQATDMSGMGAGHGVGRGQGRAGMGVLGTGWMGGMGQRLILADAQGRVLADTSQDGDNLTGSHLSAAEIASGSPILVNDQLAGTLIVASANLKAAGDPASTFLASVSRSILISVIVAGGISLILVLLFSLQITAPLRQMQRAAGAIAGGDLNQRVQVYTKDELGDLAESFNHMASNLSAAETQRKKLIADVAHELRTPLAVIQANTEGMQDGVLAVDLEQVNEIHTQTLLLGRLINDLRLLSLAEAGELHLERRETDLTSLLQQTVGRFQPQCAQKEIALSLAAEADLPVTVDVDRINQILNNLVSNALRYTPQAGQITLQASRVAGVNEVQVSVTDTGSGIPLEDLPWVFDRFYRADKSRTRASGGSGLGLAIVRQLVEAHGGRVKAESPIFHENGSDFGTRISFTLPIK